jgi:hypothetical protein
MRGEPEDVDDGEDDSVFDRAAEEGEEVFRHDWCASRPGGSGSERVYLLDGQFYYVSGDYEPGGPYASLEAALAANEPLTQITGCTVSIESTLLGDDAIVERLAFPTIDEEYKAWIDQLTAGSHGGNDADSGETLSLFGDADDNLVDGKQIRINRTRYEFRTPGTLIPMGPARG